MEGARSPRGASRKRRRPHKAPADSSGWISSSDARIAHARASNDLATARVQRFEQPALLETFGTGRGTDSSIEWIVTDEFARRFEKLRGRSRRAFAGALEQFIADLESSPRSQPRFHGHLHVRDVSVEAPVEHVHSLSWSPEGRATFLLEPGHVTWLAIGPHGSPNRMGARNR